MYPKPHIFLGLLFSLTLFLIFPSIRFSGFIIIFLSSVLIDIDHYLYYVLRKKDWSLKRAFSWFIENQKKYKKLSKTEKNKTYRAICWLHGFETFLLLMILGIFSQIFLFILAGFAFHLVLDDLYALFDKAGELHYFSAIYIFIKSKKLKHIDELK